MIGRGFPLIGQPLRSSSGPQGIRTPSPLRYPTDFPMRGGYGYEQQTPALPGVPRGGSETPRLGGSSGAPGGRRGGTSMILGSRSPVLNPFERPDTQRRIGKGNLRVPVFGVR